MTGGGVMKKINRRNFLKGSGLISIAGLGGVKLGFSQPVAQHRLNGSEKDLLVYVFLEGGMDGLHLLPPIAEPHYSQLSQLRPLLQVPNFGERSSIPLTGQDFGFHPSAPELAALFEDDKMAIIHATGLQQPNLSHFDSMGFYNLGIQDGGSAREGWVARFFRSSTHQVPPNIHAYGPSFFGVDCFAGHPSSLVMMEPENFALSVGFWRWRDLMQDSLAGLYDQPTTPIELVGNNTIENAQIIQSTDWENYMPEGNAEYPVDGLGQKLKRVAQLYKTSPGLEVAYVPYAGWDTHVNQDDGLSGDFSDLTEGLAKAISAFYADMAASNAGRFTIVIQSEFGRRAFQNNSGGFGGTDHGYGNPMMVIGDHVNPGIFGEFPGLDPATDLVGDGNLDVTVDYRDVIGEILLKRMKNRFLGYIFPGYENHVPLGIILGEGPEPIMDFNYDRIFDADFEVSS